MNAAAPAAVIVLAAGEGTRMKSSTPKVLHRIGGTTLLGHAVRAARATRAEHVSVVVRHERDRVVEFCAAFDPDLVIADQDDVKGTGRAVECGLDPAVAAAKIAAAGPVSEHRMAVVERADGVTVIDDSYNASPESMRAAMRALMDVADGGRTIAVVGEMLEMGEASRDAHWDVGHNAVRLGIDYLLVVGEGAKPAFDADLAKQTGADDYGMRSYVLVILRTGPTRVADPEERKAMFAGHMANIQRLSKEGKLALAGPFGDKQGDWRGLLVFAVGSIDEAKALVATDPVVIKGEMVAEYHAWYGSAANMLVGELHDKVARKSF